MQFSRNVFWIVATSLLAVVLLFPRYQRPGTEATLAWDVSGYYLYLPAIFLYDDLREVKFLPQVIEQYQPSFAPDQAFPVGNGHRVMKYSAGMAVLYLPFFAIGHGAAKLFGYPADGFSLPYQAAIQLGGVLVALLGLWFLRKNLLRFFSDRTAGWTILFIGLGTNFFNYATFDSANPHGWLFTLLAILLHLTLQWHERPNYRTAALIGLCVGLSALVRPTEVIYALVPLLWGITSWQGLRQKLLFLKQNLPQLAVAAMVVAAIGFVQPAYWKYVSGEWIVYSYQDQGFSFLHPHVVDVLFSYRKGWFLYTPLMLFAVAGLVFKWGTRSPALSAGQLAVVVFFVVNAWIVCAWDIWWYGGAFGQRAMIQSYALLALPLAVFWDWAQGKNWAKWVFAPLLGACVLLNLFQTYQAHWGPFETDAMNRAYYWRVFANVENNPYDRLLLDSKEGFSGEKQQVKTLFLADFEQVADTLGTSTAFAHSGKRAALVDAATEYSHTLDVPKPADLGNGDWLHISAWFYGTQQEWETWWMPQLVVRFEHQGQPVKERTLRPFRVVAPGHWGEVGMDLKTPRKPFDNIKIFAWNPAKRVPMWMDDLKVERFE